MDVDAPAPPAAAAEAWALMFELFQATKPERVALVAEFGLAPMQAMLLGQLEPGGGTPMSTLAGALHCDNSNVTHLVDRLEAAGLVQRRPSEQDRRVKTVTLTPHGAAVRTEVKRAIEQPPGALAALSEDDARALRDILGRALGR